MLQRTRGFTPGAAVLHSIVPAFRAIQLPHSIWILNFHLCLGDSGGRAGVNGGVHAVVPLLVYPVQQWAVGEQGSSHHFHPLLGTFFSLQVLLPVQKEDAAAYERGTQPQESNAQGDPH